MSNAASFSASIPLSLGATELNFLAPPQYFLNKTFVRATEVREELSRATVPISAIGFVLTSRIDLTACLEAIATPGMIESPGINA